MFSNALVSSRNALMRSDASPSLPVAGASHPYRSGCIRNDAVAALASGTMGKLHGCVLIVGTGSISYGFTEDGREARAAGAGPVLGDWGRHIKIEEVKHAISRMSRGRSNGLDEILVEFWKSTNKAVEMGLHQGPVLSPFLFALMMDELTQSIQDEVPWCESVLRGGQDGEAKLRWFGRMKRSADAPVSRCERLLIGGFALLSLLPIMLSSLFSSSYSRICCTCDSGFVAHAIVDSIEFIAAQTLRFQSSLIQNMF
ncbi:hypothetical protein FXO38_10363 [Capsicum annuum]|nr:hypothetical protein FXO38_10363 [Capsicum annuum]